jgi:hypothetical protein
MKKEHYYFHPKITFARFKKLTKGTGGDIQPEHIDEVLWRGLRDRSFNLGVDLTDKDDPVFITTKNIPDGAKLIK